MIKHILKLGIIAAGLMSFQAHAILFGGEDAGSVDNLLGVATAPNNPEDELDFINTFVDPDLLYPGDYYWKSSEFSAMASDSDPTILGFKISDVPLSEGTNSASVYDYFIVKNSVYTFAFENLDLKTWGVFDTDEMNTARLGWCADNGITDIKKCKDDNLDSETFAISHVSFFAGSNDVPEPGMMALLSVGLIGFAVSRRFKA
jgi:hypothetical protein